MSLFHGKVVTFRVLLLHVFRVLSKDFPQVSNKLYNLCQKCGKIISYQNLFPLSSPDYV